MRILTMSVMALFASFFSAGSFAASYTVDPAHTYPYFEISHLGFSTMRGRFDKTTGKLTMDRSKKTGSVDIKVDAASVSTAHAKRDKHLRSPDFLNVAEYPDITFKSTSVSFSSDTTATVKGNLTLVGVSKPVIMNVTSIKCGQNPFNKKQECGFEANMSIKRSDFGMKYGLPDTVGDEMKFNIEIEAFKD